MIAFPKPEGGYEAVNIESRPWWEFPGLRITVIAAFAFGIIVAIVQFWSAA